MLLTNTIEHKFSDEQTTQAFQTHRNPNEDLRGTKNNMSYFMTSIINCSQTWMRMLPGYTVNGKKTTSSIWRFLTKYFIAIWRIDWKLFSSEDYYVTEFFCWYCKLMTNALDSMFYRKHFFSASQKCVLISLCLKYNIIKMYFK